MKRIFCFLLVAIGLLCVEKSFAAERAHVNGQVRYAFELKKLTKEEAQAAAQKHYVDLWAYACFDEAFVTAGHILLNGDGSIRQFLILAVDNTHSYKMVNKDGTEDRTGRVAMFARPKTTTCPGGGRYEVFDNDIQTDPSIPDGVFQSLPHTLIQNSCPTWAYGASSSRGGFYTRQSDVNDFCTIIEAEGKKWYCLKMYLVRFEYKEASSFYVTFYKSSPGADGNTSNGASTFNYYADAGAGTYLVWPGQTGDNLDWSQLYSGVNDRYGFIQGGVEVIADPEMLPTAEATCGGTDATGKLTVIDWAGKTWADYSGVRFYVNKTGGTVSGRKQVSAGDLTATIPTTGDALEIAYTLTPAGYTMDDGSYADSLIWVIEDTFLA